MYFINEGTVKTARGGKSVYETIDNNKLIQINNEIKTASQWCEIFNIPRTTLGRWCNKHLDIKKKLVERGITFV